MNVLDLHPEELLDKKVNGELSLLDAQHLDEHLSRCAACRMELKLREDFQSAPVAALSIDNVVARALSGAAQRDQTHERAQAGSLSQPRRRFPMWLVAAAAFGALSSFAAVAQLTGVLPKVIAAITRSEEPTVSPSPAHTGRSGHTRPAAEPSVAIEPPPAPEHVEPAQHEAVAPTELPASPKSTVKPMQVRAPVPVAHSPHEEDAPAHDDGAELLFADANRARLSGDKAQAIESYGRLIKGYPASPEAQLSRATLGRLLLDDGRTAEALSYFNAYLVDAGGDLEEEIMAARANAFFRQGDARDEIGAWEALLEKHPHTIHAAHALARLKALGAR